ncbi:hypothetical protein [Bradyrhizobium sp. I71]|uniref:DUF6894 family protein n=1 Tax=Bradyrhizobium sp. I71 TaxID=2590772 RepID=UPI001EF8ED07|nr:hypothetical protein [Bradyrhizobium sp. I71]ULK96089.1 hypothetical protein FJV43_25530 [Bradyrhizobium sp. I71]
MASTRYFFTVMDGKLIVDEEGTLCSSWEDMRMQAITMAGHCLRDLAPKYPNGLEWQMVVTNEARETLLRMRFSLSEPGARS